MKKNLFQNYLWLILLTALYIKPAAVTYDFSGGRFGDNVLAYLHAKWISLQYNIPLMYKPFQYSDQLVLHTMESNAAKFQRLQTKKHLSKNDMTIDPQKSCLYTIPYFSEIEFERNLPWNHSWIYIAIDWDNEQFYREIVKMIAPRDNRLLHVNLPNDKITVALHVRKGEGFDGPLLSEDSKKQNNVPYADLNAPLKFPPDYFYVDQLKVVSEIFQHQKLYVYVFTDSFSPEKVVSRLKKGLGEQYPNIEFDYRKTKNTHDTNVLEDFFAMTQFDCLIRPQSSFSIAAGKVARYKVEIFPTAHHWEQHISVIDKVEVKVAKNLR